jgi:signal transduction histidine kinase
MTSSTARTGRAARLDGVPGGSGSVADHAGRLDIRYAVGGPIVVAGRLWGAMIAASLEPEPIAAGTEARIEEFAELVAAAISNVEARAELRASRARLVSAADVERRRVIRDLHDGAQQRLVHTVVTLKLARDALATDPDAGCALVAEAMEHAERATAELRELAHGILPSVLVRGGLPEAARALAARATVPVEVDVDVDRLPAPVEATAYFVMAESLTNVAKHARAGGAALAARVADGTLEVRVRDDGIGGARPDGDGLLGLADRLAVLDGRLRVESPAGGGTVVSAMLPISEYATD